MENSSELYLACYWNSSFDGASGRLCLGGHAYDDDQSSWQILKRRWCGDCRLGQHGLKLSTPENLLKNPPITADHEQSSPNPVSLVIILRHLKLIVSIIHIFSSPKPIQRLQNQKKIKEIKEKIEVKWAKEIRVSFSQGSDSNLYDTRLCRNLSCCSRILSNSRLRWPLWKAKVEQQSPKSSSDAQKAQFWIQCIPSL